MSAAPTLSASIDDGRPPAAALGPMLADAWGKRDHEKPSDVLRDLLAIFDEVGWAAGMGLRVRLDMALDAYVPCGVCLFGGLCLAMRGTSPHEWTELDAALAPIDYEDDDELEDTEPWELTDLEREVIAFLEQTKPPAVPRPASLWSANDILNDEDAVRAWVQAAIEMAEERGR